jgi:hypothetical protein
MVKSLATYPSKYWWVAQRHLKVLIVVKKQIFFATHRDIRHPLLHRFLI